jgi:hypothetical protein
MNCGQLPPVTARVRAVEALTIRLHKPNRAIIEHLHNDLPFMHLAMMKATQRHEIRHLRLTTARPVQNVVRVHVLLVRAAWEATALVTRIERTL